MHGSDGGRAAPPTLHSSNVQRVRDQVAPPMYPSFVTQLVVVKVKVPARTVEEEDGFCCSFIISSLRARLKDRRVRS